MNHLLQEFIFPDPELSDCRELYYRNAENTNQDNNVGQTTLRIAKGQSISTDTFFNSFTLSPWHEATPIQNIFISVSGQGSCKIQVCHLSSSKDAKEQILETASINSSGPSAIKWQSQPLNLRELKNGLAYLRITAVDAETVVEQVTFMTNEDPPHKVKLGLVITTFNRQKQTLQAVRRLSQNIGELSPAERAEYKILVIDNGRNLELAPSEFCSVLANPNVGGTGGFMRGLIELQQNGTFTHCLFMDDDASCFFESIARTKRLFEYSTVPKLAVSGAMLLDKPSYIQYEYSAYFRRLCRPRLTSADARDVKTLLNNDLVSKLLIRNEKLPGETSVAHGYGAWWFFAFALKDIELYSFPFFVRGDDAFFSIHNKLRVFAMSGVASWQESFNYKTAPITTYLDCRSTLLQTLLLPGQNIVLKFAQCLWLIYFFVIQRLFTYQYVEARASLIAINDILKGPQFWFDNIVYETYLKKVTASLALPRVTINDATLVEVGNVPKGNIGARAFRLLLLNGHILPSHLEEKKSVTFREGQKPPASLIFRLTSYSVRISGETNMFHHYERNVVLFFRLGLQGFFAINRFAVSFFSLRSKYLKATQELKSRTVWLNLLKT
jgi:galactofuranosylgalactofuranosylrhamnosyl-N-acetylglucosaminyl-diphospho-decaprenol beta-1,5/1,6-galactofuranosyltransferase